MNSEVFACCDCNNFYVSCERVFQPHLENVPVIVLSNNDGCVIARSNDIKKLIPMGTPFFKCEPLIEEHGIKWFSSNYTLYGDMSGRVMQTLARLAPEVECYSIDEAFLKFHPGGSHSNDAVEIRKTIKKWTGIPVSVGLATTKTLTKVANEIAKKRPEHNGVFDLTGENVDDYLKDFPVGDLWGVGRRYAKMLLEAGVETALQLKRMPDSWIRRRMTIQGLRLVYELRGISCLPIEAFEKPKKAIASTRSFGTTVYELKELKEAVAAYVTRGAEKLRWQSSAAAYLRVFIHTSLFAPNPFYSSKGMPLEIATSYTPDLIATAHYLLERIYKSGPAYTKAGIMLENLVPDTNVQLNLFRSVDFEQRERIMKAVDNINRRHGRGMIRSANVPDHPRWRMKAKHITPRYTTRWNELMTVKAH